jgi:hypothetical protein
MLPDTEDMGRLKWPPLSFGGDIFVMGEIDVGSSSDPPAIEARVRRAKSLIFQHLQWTRRSFLTL